MVCYISHNSSLACTDFAEGAWSDPAESAYADGLSQYAAASTSRHLAVAFYSSEEASHATLLYESADNKVSMLDGSWGTDAQLEAIFVWNNASRKLQSSSLEALPELSAPFSIWSDGQFTEALFAGQYEAGGYTDFPLLVKNMYHKSADISGQFSVPVIYETYE